MVTCSVEAKKTIACIQHNQRWKSIITFAYVWTTMPLYFTGDNEIYITGDNEILSQMIIKKL